MILLCGGAYLYGTYFEIKNYQRHDYKIDSQKITDNFDGFSIVHISDIHYGRVLGNKELDKIVEMINKVKPDVVVLTGDLLDRDTKMTTDMASDISNALTNIKVNIGKYAINGNHDSNFDEWDSIIKDSGFINLNNSYDTIYNGGYEYLLIAGVSSFKDKESIVNKVQNATSFLNKFEKH